MQEAQLAKPIIDVDRGVEMHQIVKFDKVNSHKFEPDMKYGGLTVYMYVDEPGIYYDVHGNKLPEGIAKLAGYAVDKLAKQRRKKEALAAFDEQMRKELSMEPDEESRVLAEDGDWQVVSMPGGRAKIVDKDTGRPVTAMTLAEKDAIVLLKELVNSATDTAVATAPQPKAK